MEAAAARRARRVSHARSRRGGVPVWLAHPSYLCCATVGPSRNSTTIQNLTRVGLLSPSRRRGDPLSALCALTFLSTSSLVPLLRCRSTRAAFRRCAPARNMGRVCSFCQVSATPQWRSGSRGQTLCNACGLRRRTADRSGGADGLCVSAVRSGIRRSGRHGGGGRRSPGRVGRVGQGRKNDNSPQPTASSRQPVAARSVFPACKPPPSDTTASGASAGSPHTARPTAGTASPVAATSPSALAATSPATGETPGSATCPAVRRDDVAAVPAPASPSKTVQWGPSAPLPQGGASKDVGKALAGRFSDGASVASVGAGGEPETGTLAAVGLPPAATTPAHGPSVARSTLRPDASTGVASFADRAAAVIALTRRAAMSGRLFLASSTDTAFPRSSSLMTPETRAPLPLAVAEGLPPSHARVHHAPCADAGRPPALSWPRVCSVSPPLSEGGQQATAAACRGGIAGPHESVPGPLRPAHGASAGRPLLSAVRPLRSSSAADDFAGAPSAGAFRQFTPYQVGVSIASFAGVQLSPGRQVELMNELTMGAIEGNIAGIVAVEEDISLVTAAIMTFCHRTHRGNLPYATECRVMRFLRRMR